MTEQPPTPLHTARLKFTILLAMLAFAEFLARGPVPALLGKGGDLVTPYVAAARLLHHQDPYSSSGVLEDLKTYHIVPGLQVDDSALHPIYPPTALTLFFPFAVLPWSVARAIYVLLCSGLYIFLAIRFSELIESGWYGYRRWAFLAFAFALAPMQTGIRLANPSAIACILFFLSLIRAYDEDDAGAALWLALCLCIKPTIGPPALFFFLLCKRWRLSAFCTGFMAVIVIYTAVFMKPIDRSWILNLQQNTVFMFSKDGAASFFGQYADCINLQMPFYAIFHSTLLANVLAWTTVSLLTLWWLVVFLKVQKRRPEWSWILVAAISLIGLLPVYQRTYNAGIVLLAVLFFFQNPKSRPGRIIFLLSTVFLLPIRSILVLKATPHLSPAFTQSKLWQAGFLCLDSWVLVAIVILAIHTASQRIPQIFEQDCYG